MGDAICNVSDETGNEGGFGISLIEEGRNCQRYADEPILRSGDRYDLSSYRFDWQKGCAPARSFLMKI